MVVEAIEKFLKTNETQTLSIANLDKYIGILNEDEIDKDYKNSREVMLKEKYL